MLKWSKNVEATVWRKSEKNFGKTCLSKYHGHGNIKFCENDMSYQTVPTQTSGCWQSLTHFKTIKLKILHVCGGRSQYSDKRYGLAELFCSVTKTLTNMHTNKNIK